MSRAIASGLLRIRRATRAGQPVRGGAKRTTCGSADLNGHRPPFR